MGGPVSLRKIPPHALQLAHHLCEQTGLSIADVLRQAIVSGLLVEATRFAPDQDGTLGRLEAAYLAKALRRHLSSAIDLLLEYEQHPYQELMRQEGRKQTPMLPKEPISSQEISEQKTFFEAIGEDLDQLGMGMSFTAALGNHLESHKDQE